ncbi:MAG: ThiF family adenylyltransferase [Methylophilus sp.]|nr:ThiF family adenylyltransferase [Methylophilus sp.]
MTNQIVPYLNQFYGWLDTDAPQASAIMLPDGEMFGRSITPLGLGESLRLIRIVGDDIKYWLQKDLQSKAPEHAIRLVQTFGEGTYEMLRGLRAGLVGCSGTGSIIAEQLLRNYIGTLIAVDPDDIELKNLNRILNSSSTDVKVGKNKVTLVAETAGKIDLGTTVITYATDLKNPEVIHALSQCDVIFGCMDSIDGRHILNKLASYYLIPYIDMGVRIDADGTGGVEAINGAVHYIKPCGSSLLSRGIYTMADLEAASMQRHAPDQYEAKRKEGYIKGVRVDQPAVISVNMQIAAMAFNEFLARIHPYRVEPNKNYAQRRVVISDPEASRDLEEGEPCKTFTKYLAKGDQKPLLGLLGLE